MADRLTRTSTGYAESTIEDLISMVMANVEDGLLGAGAKPGKDYTMNDLINWSMPFVHKLREQEGSKWGQEWSTEWPDYTKFPD